MPVTSEAMKGLISKNAEHNALRRLALEEGMTPIRGAALRLISQGLTSVTEAFRVVEAD
jgi:type II secretory ATPase GspE/PulE/Tfp pilus assembly ATPase PilB-like protein